jgi:hypothetical protein
MNGGYLPLAGRYAHLGTAHASPVRVIELFFEHLAGLDFAVGVIPFAAALLGGVALVRAGLPRGLLVFASAALATTFWILLEVALAAAEFDATSLHPRPGSAAMDLPRIHERYLIYLIPLFLVALFAALPLLRGRVPLPHHVAIAVAATALPAAIPLGTVINSTNAVDSFALQIFARDVPDKVVASPHAAFLIVALSALAAFVYLLAAFQPFPALAVAMTALAFLGLSAAELGRQTGRIKPSALGLPVHANWVDRVVGSHGEVALVAGGGVRPLSIEETAFANTSIARVYRTCGAVFGSDFGEQRVSVDGTRGILWTGSGPVRTRYAVVPTAFHAPGRPLRRNAEGSAQQALVRLLQLRLWRAG